MKLPKTFKPKNLDEKTEQLINKANIHKELQPNLGKKVLDDFFEFMNDSMSTYDKVEIEAESLLKKENYQKLTKNAALRYDHWYKQDPIFSDWNYVLSKRSEQPVKGPFIVNPYWIKDFYTFSRADKKGLVKHCQGLENLWDWRDNIEADHLWDYDKLKKISNTVYWGAVGVGSVVGGIFSFYLNTGFKGGLFFGMAGGGLGMCAAHFTEGPVVNFFKKMDVKKYHKAEKDLMEHGGEIIWEDEAALRRAFEYEIA